MPESGARRAASEEVAPARSSPDSSHAASSPDGRRSPPTARQLWIIDLGHMAYAEALELQRAAARARIAGDVPQDLLLLVEHPPVVTLGRSSKERHLVASPALLATRGVERHEVERGGDVTFHGPGQLVGYAIMDLKRHRLDLHWYLRQVEEALIRALADVGIAASRNPGLTGVWTSRADSPDPTSPPRKIASIGVHARDWVTWHGFALNVTTDLSFFDLIIPCGIADVEMTSIARELAPRPTDAEGVVDSVERAFGDVFELTPLRMPLESLRLEVATPS